MFPDLRLLISATVATFFLAAMAGLYASLRITQDQLPARADARALTEDNPVTRIANTWPSPEPARAAALRDLAKITKHSPAAISEPASPANPGEVKVEPTEPPSGQPANPPAMAEGHSHVLLNERRAQDAAGSTGVAVPPESGAVNQADHSDIRGNVGKTAAIKRASPRAEKDIRPAKKKPPQLSKKKRAQAVQRRQKPAPAAERPAEQLATGYPLYLTVPITH